MCLSNHLQCSVGYGSHMWNSFMVQKAMVCISFMFMFCGFVKILPTTPMVREAEYGGQSVKHLSVGRLARVSAFQDRRTVTRGKLFWS